MDYSTEYYVENIVVNSNSYSMAWASIIVCVTGFIIVLYIAINPYIDFQRKFFGTILLTLWTILWGLILWRLWEDGYEAQCWWLLVVPITLIVLYFILIILLNVEASV